MAEYIIVMHPDPTIRDRLIFTSAREGLLVTAPSTPEAIHRQIERYGPPALLICQSDPAAPDSAAILTDLKETGYPRFLGIFTQGNEAPPKLGDHVLDALDDFLLWPADEAEILLRVRRLLALVSASRPARPSYFANGKRVGSVPLPAGGADRTGRLTASLSGIEREILRRLEAANGSVVPAEKLAEVISTKDPDRQVNTLRVHISRLRKKLEQDPRQPSHIVTVRGVGYRLGQ